MPKVIAGLIARLVSTVQGLAIACMGIIAAAIIISRSDKLSFLQGAINALQRDPYIMLGIVGGMAFCAILAMRDAQRRKRARRARRYRPPDNDWV